ncbi:MAG: clostripain-related cysteine peptidase [Candidatus Helarchaeota archaeon]
MEKKKFSAIIIVFFLLIVIFIMYPSPSGNPPEKILSPPYMVKGTAKYTYISYICADNNLGYYGQSDLNEMELGYNDTVTDVYVLALLDLYTGDTSAYYISHDEDPNTITSVKLTGTGLPAEANLGNPNTLITWVNFCMTYYPAEHYILDLWDHGSGWEICFDDTSGGDSLTMAELRYALETINSTTGNQIDILAMDACLMGTLEVAYEVNDLTSILVSSEDAVLASGFPYDTIINDLCTNPNQNVTEFASNIIDLFYASQHSFISSTLSAVNTTLVKSKVYPSFSLFAQNLYSYLDFGIKNELYTARVDSEDFYDPDFIDLYDFAKNTLLEASNTTIQQNAQELMSNLSISVINEKDTSNPGAYGLSIYFPLQKSSYNSQYQTHFSLSNDSHWDEFLLKYYNTSNFGLGLRYYQLNDSLGDNDNTPDPGETLLIDLELENIGEIEGQFVNGTLISLDTENATVLDSFKSYNNIGIDSSTTRTFSFNISGGCSPDQILTFHLSTQALFDTYLIARNFTIEIVVGRTLTIGGKTLQSATEISVGIIYGNLPGPGFEREAWLKINATANLYLFLNLTGPEFTDFDLYVYDPDELIVSVAGRPTYPDLCSLFILENGFYYLKLIAYGSGTGYYQLYVNFTTSPYEDGLHFGTAFTLTDNSTTSGTLPGPNNTDFLYYRVIVQAGMVLLVNLQGSSGTDFDLYIYDPSLHELSRSTSPSSTESCSARASRTGYYYIILVRYSGSGTYTLQVTITTGVLPLWLFLIIIGVVIAVILLTIYLYAKHWRPPPAPSPLNPSYDQIPFSE